MSNHPEQVPAARIVRQGSVMVPQPRVPLRERLAPMGPALRTAGYYVVGLWPIWAVAGLAIAFLWVAGLRGSP